MPLLVFISFFFFFNDTATTEIYTLSLHDALPISVLFLAAVALLGQLPEVLLWRLVADRDVDLALSKHKVGDLVDRKSTRLNSSHLVISYAVFCLKKKK